MAARKVEVRRYIDGDGDYVAKNMREADKEEIMYLTLMRPAPAIRMTVSHAVGLWTGLVDGEIACIFGINRKTLTSDIGVPWLLGTPLMNEVPFAFLRGSLGYYKRMEKAFPQMENYVMADHKHAVSWLSWLGFDMGEPMPIGVGGREYIRFTKGF